MLVEQRARQVGCLVQASNLAASHVPVAAAEAVEVALLLAQVLAHEAWREVVLFWRRCFGAISRQELIPLYL